MLRKSVCIYMANLKVVKTEHNGAKHGHGAWGTKVEAKQASKKTRRRNWKLEVKTIDFDILEICY